jgi:hypothetical protein
VSAKRGQLHAREWIKAMNQFQLLYPDRFTPQAL